MRIKTFGFPIGGIAVLATVLLGQTAMLPQTQAHVQWGWLPKGIHRVEWGVRAPVSSVVLFAPSAATGGTAHAAPVQRNPNALYDNVKVNQDNGPFPHNETTAAVVVHYPSGFHPQVIAGANDYRIGDGNNGVYNTYDADHTWSDFLSQGITSAPWYFNGAGDPSIAIDPAGNALYASLGFDRSDSRSAVFVSRLEYKNAEKWVTPWPTVVAYNNNSNIFNDKEWIATDDSATSKYLGNTYVSWTRFDQGKGDSPIWIAVSTDDAMSFPHHVEISGSSSSLCGGACDQDQGSQVSVTQNGTIVVTFENFGNSIDQILSVSSTNGGKTWSSPVRVGVDLDIPSPLNGAYFRDNSFPAMTADPAAANTLYVAWANYAQGEADILMSVSTDGGAHWSRPTMVNTDRGGSTDHFFPAVTSTGTDVYVGYYTRQQGNGTPLSYVVSRSLNAGKAFNRPITVTNVMLPEPLPFEGQFMGDYSAITSETNVATDYVFPVWTDTRSVTNEDIYSAEMVFSH